MRRAKFMRWSHMSLVWLTLALCVIVAKAQVDTGTILGTITDASGAVIPGANVTLVNQLTAAQLTAKSDSDGRFNFTPLQIGTYRIEVEFSGFKKTTIQNVHLNIQQQALVNVVLQPGMVTESVEVGAAPELMQTQSGSVGQ